MRFSSRRWRWWRDPQAGPAIQLAAAGASSEIAGKRARDLSSSAAILLQQLAYLRSSSTCRNLQGVAANHACRSPLLRSADDDRLRQPLPPAKPDRAPARTSPWLSRKYLQGVGPAKHHPHRPRRAPQLQSAPQPLQTPGLAAQAQETIGRVNPANPQPSARHERAHVTVELETAKPAARNFLHSGPGSMTSSNEKR